MKKQKKKKKVKNNYNVAIISLESILFGVPYDDRRNRRELNKAISLLKREGR